MNESPMRALERDLANGATVLLDGATGTEIEKRGAEMHDGAWCAMATLTHPDVLRAVHEDYIRAGARVITTNTFSTNRNMLDPAGLGDRFEEVNRRAVEIALEARENAGVDGVVIAASMSHQVPFVQVGGGRTERHPPPPDVVRRNFQEMANLFAGSGVDLVLLEMMSNPDLANPAIDAAKNTGLPVWVGFSVRADEAGTLRSYAREDITAREMFDAIPLDGVGAAGVMHSAAEATGPANALLRESFAGPLMAYPDSGYFTMPHWQFVDIMPPAELANFGRRWRDEGAQVIGGCCGLGVEHIEALAELLPTA